VIPFVIFYIGAVAFAAWIWRWLAVFVAAALAVVAFTPAVMRWGWQRRDNHADPAAAPPKGPTRDRHP
jgi:hypothetical protein